MPNTGLCRCVLNCCEQHIMKLCTDVEMYYFCKAYHGRGHQLYLTAYSTLYQRQQPFNTEARLPVLNSRTGNQAACAFYKTGCSLPRSQKNANGPHPEADESDSRPHILLHGLRILAPVPDFNWHRLFFWYGVLPNERIIFCFKNKWGNGNR
jgi:hypothetical protein